MNQIKNEIFASFLHRIRSDKIFSEEEISKLVNTIENSESPTISDIKNVIVEIIENHEDKQTKH